MRAWIFGISVCIAAPVGAQELRSIGDTIAAISDQMHATAYMTSRCAGFYDGAIAYGGANMGEKLVTSFRDTSATMTMGHTVVRMLQAKNRGQDVPTLDEQLQRSVEEAHRFTEIYSSRFQSNYELTGTMMESDPVAQSDLVFCAEVAPGVQELVLDVLGGTENE